MMIDLHLTSRRKGEILMTISGIALAIGAASISVPQVAYAGLCISGLGIVSMLWRWPFILISKNSISLVNI